MAVANPLAAGVISDSEPICGQEKRPVEVASGSASLDSMIPLTASDVLGDNAVKAVAPLSSGKSCFISVTHIVLLNLSLLNTFVVLQVQKLPKSNWLIHDQAPLLHKNH